MEENKIIVMEYVDKFNAGDIVGLRSIFSDNALIHGVLGWGKVDEIIPIWKALIEGLAIKLQIEDIIAEGDNVAVRFLERGTSVAPFFDKPATGKSYEITAMEWFLVSGGKIQRRWGTRDAASQARQLGWDEPASKEGIKN